MPLEATALAVYLHGLAGDIAAESVGEGSLVATDLVRFLPQAFAQVRTPRLSQEFAFTPRPRTALDDCVAFFIGFRFGQFLIPASTESSPSSECPNGSLHLSTAA